MIVQINKDTFINTEKVEMIQIFGSTKGSKVLEVTVACKSVVVEPEYVDDFMLKVVKDNKKKSNLSTQFVSV